MLPKTELKYIRLRMTKTEAKKYLKRKVHSGHIVNWDVVNLYFENNHTMDFWKLRLFYYKPINVLVNETLRSRK